MTAVLAYGAQTVSTGTAVALFQGVMVLGAMLGFACASVFMVREHLPEATPMTLPQT